MYSVLPLELKCFFLFQRLPTFKGKFFKKTFLRIGTVYLSPDVLVFAAGIPHAGFRQRSDASGHHGAGKPTASTYFPVTSGQASVRTVTIFSWQSYNVGAIVPT